MRNVSPPSLGPSAVVAILGPLQILAWGSTFYLLGVLGRPIAGDTGWPFAGVVAGLSIALLAAGLVAPLVGRRIATLGGRPVLAVGSVFMAVGLAVMALSPNLLVYLLAWAITGCGMGAGLYDPAFSTLGQLYGRDARRLVTAVTLFGGFASTVAWPVTAYLLNHVGWRATCGIYAIMEMGMAMPCYLVFLPRREGSAAAKPVFSVSAAHDLPATKHALALLLLGTVLTLGAGLLSLISTHLLIMLQARGFTLAMAVGLGGLVGPSQVGARILEMTFGGNRHPVWAMLAGTILVTIGLGLLWSGWSVPAMALIAYGMGNGLASIVRASVPLILFGPERYPELMGRLGRPILLSMALAPLVGAVVIQYGSANLALALTVVIALLDVVVAAALVRLCTH